jgi:hypothetical protein
MPERQGAVAARPRRKKAGSSRPGAALPFAPRISARSSYRLHKILDRRPAWNALACKLEGAPRLYGAFVALEERTKTPLYGCVMCGQCALPITGYACPMSCPKQLRNGPCGGVRTDGTCEVYPEARCVWVIAYERAESAGHLEDLSLLQRPVDQRRLGESAWVNFWRGRDAAMAIVGDEPPSDNDAPSEAVGAR